ncbi:MAG: ABC transporter ATP-binding protein [Deltaproteobacteria bacterium HGW-Deltaproteobacteria-15]|jgi:branched-chain amino acid transport system ATP-binding protein|nr:MAG: ABC transporter ATP-binding protein [Deltaproteobacteria bacterium HGW-Deltaproteobacteria-15]
MIALNVKSLSKMFGGLRAAHNVSLEIEQGERRAIIGPNGAGKTTLFHLISGFLFPSSGRVSLFGRDVTRMRAHQRAALGIARTFQVTNLFQRLTLFENILLGVQAVKAARFCFYRRAKSFGAITHEVEGLLKEWSLWEKRNAVLKELSYGEQREIEVIMALASKPRLLLLDEPTAGLSPAETVQVTELIKRLPRDMTMILIEHDMDVAFAIAEKVSVLYFGSVLEEGTVEQIKGNPKVAEVYLG